MKALVKEGHEVCAVVPRGEVYDKFEEHGIRPVKYKINRAGLTPLSGLKTIFELYRIFKRERFDLVHTFTIKPNIYGSIAARLARVPVIINHVTGLGFIFLATGIKASILRSVSKVLYRVGFRCANKIIFQNPDDLEYMARLLDRNKTVVVKGTGVDTDFFSSGKVNGKEQDNLRQEFSIKKDTVVITFIGRLLWHKGIGELMEAAQELTAKYDNMVFLVVGWIDQGNPACVTKKFIDALGENRRIIFTGQRDDVREILSLTDVFVLPSYREGTPRTVLEAMSMGVPIITTNVPGCSQTVEEGRNGVLVPVKDSRALSAAIEKLTGDGKLRDEMGKAGREKVVAEFSDNVVVEKIFNIYKELL